MWISSPGWDLGPGGLESGAALGSGAELESGAEPWTGADVAHQLPSGAARTGPTGSPALSWLSLRVAAVSMVGFGAAGFSADYLGLPGFVSWPLAGAGFLLVGAGTHALILKPLAAQQYNSLMSRYNYVGQDAVVTVGIRPGGLGQVTFRDRQGARVRQTASSDQPAAVAQGVTVQIVDLVPGGVVVHHNSFSD